MATKLTATPTTRAGVDIAGAAAPEVDLNFDNSGNEMLMVYNGGASPITVTFDIPKTVDGKAIADLVVTVPASGRRLIGPFPKQVYNQTNGTVVVTLSATTSVTVLCLQVGTLNY